VIRVLIIAAPVVFARGLASLLAEDDRMETIDIRSEGGAASAHPDVILASGIALDEITFEAVPVVLLSNEPFDTWDHAGPVRAWLPLSAAPNEVVAAIVAANEGLTVITPAQSEAMFEAPRASPRAASLSEPLSPRELQVLRMLAEGLGNKEIAWQLGISDHTVKFHVASILGKLRASTRTEAVALGLRQGLVPI
jgi:DNA-binding CsgD family transcriptional regulator